MRLMACAPLPRLVFPLAALAATALACTDEDSGVTYEKNISSLFTDCTLCHRPGAPYGPDTEAGPDILDPYSADDGLIVAPNYWKKFHDELPVPPQLVVPGQPDDSFLISKISDPSLNLLADNGAGVQMPYQVPRITPEELLRIEQWVSSGAQDDDFYRDQVATIFIGPNSYTPGKCDLCHYHGAPNPPDITEPFGPEGLVGVPSIFRDDLLRVAPGDPDASLLVQRVRASAGDNLPGSEFGAPMPKPIAVLSEAQVELVREWISAGARP